MKTVYLTSGPRGSGKTRFIERVRSLYPEIEVISRDLILIELFGSTSLNPYEGGHYIALKVFFERIGEFLSGKEGRLIIDCWNGFSHERKAIIKKLRDLGADYIVCWQFIVPVNTCVQWFFAKEDSKGYSETGIRRDHELYYRTAENIGDDGFDGILHIDPCQPEISLELFQ